MNTLETNATKVIEVPPAPLRGPSAPTRAPGIKLSRVGAIVVVVLMVAVLVGVIPRWRQRTALRAETQELAVPTVTVVSPAPGKVAVGLALPAELKPLIEAPIYARASGYLKRWLTDIGQPVEAGQLMAEIDTPELNQELARSRAELGQAEASLELAKTTANRWADLLKTASVSEQEASEKKADLALKLATVAAAQANVRRLEELQSFQRVTAPFAGIVTARTTDTGELIAAGGTKQLFRLAQIQTLRVFARVPQSIARSVSPGQTAELTLPELPSRTFTAKVVRTSGAMSADSRTLLTELEVDNSKGELLAGGYAQVRFTETKTAAALTLPSNTLLFRAEGPQVGVVRADGKVELVRVGIGRDFGATLEILDGVSATDRVILNPADSLVSGTIVRVADNAKAADRK